MRYNIDILKLAWQLTPPILRSGVWKAILKACLCPIVWLYDQFRNYKDGVDTSLNTTGNVQVLERMLNDRFFLEDSPIYITTMDEYKYPPFYFVAEMHAANTIYKAEEGIPYHLPNAEGVTYESNFVVHIPTYLCTDLDKSKDKYKGVNRKIIEDILAKYRPAGRTYKIELYDYE